MASPGLSGSSAASPSSVVTVPTSNTTGRTAVPFASPSVSIVTTDAVVATPTPVRKKEYEVDEARATALLAKMLETVNNPTQNDAGEDVPGAGGGEVQGCDITLLKSKDATITTLRTKLASEIEERVKKLAALDERIAALEIKLRDSEERARASEERANKMKDAAVFLMGNM